jgi:acetylornithine deacetylase/succinyl-diaminopimelate desuccinylase-like protein
VVSALFEAGTDASAWRQRGIPVYGIYPYPLDNDTLERMHGNDERISMKSLDEGTQMIFDTLSKVAGK